MARQTISPVPTSPWRNRIVGYDEKPASWFLANPANWRIHPYPQQDGLQGVLDEVGWVQDVIVNRRSSSEWGHDQHVETMVDGHLRVSLALRHGDETPVPLKFVDLTPQEENLVLTTLDPLTSMAAADKVQLDALLREVSTSNPAIQAILADLAQKADLYPTGAGSDEGRGPETSIEQAHQTLAERFIVPPFSVLDARQGYWQERKRAWLALGIQSELGRGGGISPGGSPRPAMKLGSDGHTVIFDPVLCELAYRWFCPPGGSILDPFAGGSVRGIVAAVLGYAYTGVDLRSEQIAANEEQALGITPNYRPRWIVGDSRHLAEIAPGEYDLLFTCPPYYDLEQYSDDPQDLSNAINYHAFSESFGEIIAQAVSLLNEDRFAVIVVGDIRDKAGFYQNLVRDTIGAFQGAGARLYNDAVLVTAIGSLPIRVGKQFASSRKLGKTHQNVLIFCKGDPRKATEACGPVEVVDLAEAYGEVTQHA